MGFFSDLGKKTSELGKKTSEATGKIAKEAKLKLKISDDKGKIQDLYEDLGKKVYEKHIREENIEIKDDLLEICDKIDALAKEIEDARLEILALNQKKLCSKCSAEIEEKAAFCQKCGEKQAEVVTIKEEALEKLENAEIPQEKEQEAESVKEDLKEEINEENQ